MYFFSRPSDKSLRILLLDSTSSYGGALEMALALTQKMAGETEIEWILGTAFDPLFLRQRLGEKAARVKCVAFPPFAIRPEPIGGARSFKIMHFIFQVLLQDLPQTVRLFWFLLKHRIDLVHLNNLLNLQYPYVVAAKLARVPCVLSHRDFEYPSRLIRWIAPWVQHHIAISAVIQQSIEGLGVPAAKITRIHDSVDLVRCRPRVPSSAGTEADPDKITDKVIFTFLGRIVRWKGVEVFIEAAAKVLHENPKAEAWIIGSAPAGGELYESSVKEKVHKLGLEKRILFQGYQADPVRWIQNSQVVVHTSRTPEPFGLVVLEAMACAVPVVAMAEGGPLEVVQDGVDGFLRRPGDSDGIADAIRILLRDPALREKMGQAGLAKVREAFASEICAQKHLLLYRFLNHRRAITGVSQERSL